jgi:hypothetical protein
MRSFHDMPHVIYISLWNGTVKRELKVCKERTVNDLKGDETQVKIQELPCSILVIMYDKKNHI